jgi:hypothetical protein
LSKLPRSRPIVGNAVATIVWAQEHGKHDPGEDAQDRGMLD